MSSLNRVMLIGNLGRDPEVKTHSSGGEVASFSLATTDYWKDKQTGERQSKTEWHRVVVFNQNLVALVRNYLRKGASVYVEGQLRTRKYIGKSGIEKEVTEVCLQSTNAVIQLLSGGNKGQSNCSEDEDIPF